MKNGDNTVTSHSGVMTRILEMAVVVTLLTSCSTTGSSGTLPPMRVSNVFAECGTIASMAYPEVMKPFGRKEPISCSIDSGEISCGEQSGTKVFIDVNKKDRQSYTSECIRLKLE